MKRLVDITGLNIFIYIYPVLADSKVETMMG